MKNFKIRQRTVDDLPFLKQALYLAVLWNPQSKKIPIDQLFTEPEIAKIFEHWGEIEGDFSLIAVDEQNNPIAAIWYRFFSEENQSYGFYDEQTPEIGLSVLEEYRSMGIGTTLMQSVIEHARREKIKKLSLSVDPKNYAIRLYEKFGFMKVGENGTAWTMLKTL